MEIFNFKKLIQVIQWFNYSCEAIHSLKSEFLFIVKIFYFSEFLIFVYTKNCKGKCGMFVYNITFELNPYVKLDSTTS